MTETRYFCCGSISCISTCINALVPNFSNINVLFLLSSYYSSVSSFTSSSSWEIFWAFTNVSFQELLEILILESIGNSRSKSMPKISSGLPSTENYDSYSFLLVITGLNEWHSSKVESKSTTVSPGPLYSYFWVLGLYVW